MKTNVIFNFLNFQFLIIKDLILFILSLLFIITFAGFDIDLLKDFRFYFYIFFIFFNVWFSKENYNHYKYIFKKNNIDFYVENKKYLTINNLLFLSYLIINFYYINLIQLYLFLLNTIIFFYNLSLNKSNNHENRNIVDLNNIIEHRMNRRII